MLRLPLLFLSALPAKCVARLHHVTPSCVMVAVAAALCGPHNNTCGIAVPVGACLLGGCVCGSAYFALSPSSLAASSCVSLHALVCCRLPGYY